MTLDRSIADALRRTSTGTIHTILLKKGVRRTWMRGPQPIFHAGERDVGPAFTLRFVPAREDLATPGILVVAALDARGDRGHAGGRASRSPTRMGVHRRRHLRRHPLRPHEEARRRRARHRRRDARRRRRRGHRPAGLVLGRGRAAPRSRASPSSAGRSRSAAAASRCSRTT